jgi:hypothetical protein
LPNDLIFRPKVILISLMLTSDIISRRWHHLPVLSR